MRPTNPFFCWIVRDFSSKWNSNPNYFARALRATDNNIERAVDWIFSHAGEAFDDIEPEAATPRQVSEEPGHAIGTKYKMVRAIQTEKFLETITSYILVFLYRSPLYHTLARHILLDITFATFLRKVVGLFSTTAKWPSPKIPPRAWVTYTFINALRGRLRSRTYPLIAFLGENILLLWKSFSYE